MDIAKGGGYLILGVILLVAYCDGGLGILIIATCLAFVVYKATYFKMEQVAQSIQDISRSRLGQWVEEVSEPSDTALLQSVEGGRLSSAVQDEANKERKRRQTDSKQVLEDLDKKRAQERAGNQNLCMLVGLVAFAFPPAGIVALVALFWPKCWTPSSRLAHQGTTPVTPAVTVTD